ncbi:MAG: FHA domain-containing protein [Clostridia bacterium]|jgi:hypothetical protein|nr:FHA domain-containing protein [Clostridia bacterium]
MKQVKECPECGYYNAKRSDSCSRCACRLDVPIIEADDNLSENPDFGLKALPQDDELNFQIDQKRIEYVCKDCGESYTIESPDALQKCKFCNRIVYDPFKGGNLCDEKKQTSNISNSEKTFIAPCRKVLRFVNVDGKEGFCLSFDAEIKAFGRSFCNLDYIKQNVYVSRAHVYYFLKDGKAYVTDNSANGTFINDVKLVNGEPSLIEAGDKIRFYTEEFIVKYEN